MGDRERSKTAAHDQLNRKEERLNRSYNLLYVRREPGGTESCNGNPTTLPRVRCFKYAGSSR